MHKYKYTNTETQTQIHKYKYTNKKIHKCKNTQIDGGQRADHVSATTLKGNPEFLKSQWFGNKKSTMGI